jgi:hypothetical protein
VTLLITGGVGGQLLPEGEGAEAKGGAAEALVGGNGTGHSKDNSGFGAHLPKS